MAVSYTHLAVRQTRAEQVAHGREAAVHAGQKQDQTDDGVQKADTGAQQLPPAVVVRCV